jgi:hypothetical protein
MFYQSSVNTKSHVIQAQWDSSSFALDSNQIKSGEKWIGRDGPIPLQSCSPDLSLMDFFLWGYLKCLVYAISVHSP